MIGYPSSQEGQSSTTRGFLNRTADKRTDQRGNIPRRLVTAGILRFGPQESKHTLKKLQIRPTIHNFPARTRRPPCNWFPSMHQSGTFSFPGPPATIPYPTGYGILGTSTRRLFSTRSVTSSGFQILTSRSPLLHGNVGCSSQNLSDVTHMIHPAITGRSVAASYTSMHSTKDSVQVFLAHFGREVNIKDPQGCPSLPLPMTTGNTMCKPWWQCMRLRD